MNARNFAIWHSVTAIIALYLIQYYNAIGFLIEADPTRITFLILGIYIACSAYLVFGRNFAAVKYVASRLTGIGLIGTIIGIMLLFADVQTVAQENLMHALFSGMATVLITTLFGIASWLLLDFQLGFCFGQIDDE